MRSKNKLKAKRYEPKRKINKPLLILILFIITDVLAVIDKFFVKDDVLRVVLNFLILPGLAASSFLGTKYLLDRRII